MEKDILLFFGVYPVVVKHIFYRLRKCATFIITTLQIFSMILLIVQNDISILIECMTFLATQIGFVGKLYNFTRKSDIILDIEEFLHRRSFNTFSFQSENEIRKDLSSTRKLAVSFRVLMVIYVLMCIFLPIAQDRKLLPLPGKYNDLL